MNKNAQNGLFEAYQNKVTRAISKILMGIFFVVPAYWLLIFLVNLTGLVKIDARSDLFFPSLVLGLVVCTLPTIMLKLKVSMKLIKYFAVIPLALIIIFFYAYIGAVVRILFVIMPIISTLYFDRKFTLIMSIVNHVIILVGVYIASPIEVLRYTIYDTANTVFIAKALSLSLEFLPIIAVLVALAGFARGLMDKLAEAENEKYRIEIAEAKNKAKSAFLATMSHEIRTPMNAILGITQMELNDPELPEKNIQALERINASGNTLLGIINDILDMSKIEAGKFELNPAEYDVPSFIHDSTQQNILRIGSKEIRFLIEADENLPSRMFGDELRIRQIVNNLLSNAFKYTEKGHVKLTITHEVLSPLSDEIELKFVVEDTGQGMKPDDLKKLFSEYTRFNQDINRGTEGTGIGLNITNSLIKMMDGTINVDSEYGKGSVFTITIRQKAVKGVAPIGAEISENLRNFILLGKKERKQIEYEIMPYGRVLIVDDVDTNLYVARGLMAPYQLEIETAQSGFEAIEILKEDKTFDIVFMDHMMPKMDGIETTKKLRENGYPAPIIALTANAIVGNDKMFKENGFDDFISKPIDIRQLNTILHKWIRDKYPKEAKKYKTATIAAKEFKEPGKSKKLFEIFHKDAKKAVVALRESKDGDVKLFTTTIHAMKSALTNIGEAEKAILAEKLEMAGRNNDLTYINENADAFIEVLEALIVKLTPKENENDDNLIFEDVVYLKEELILIASACEEYNDKEAYEALARLKEKQWKKETSDGLAQIHETLFFSSDFDNAVIFARKIIKEKSKGEHEENSH
ncbi:MAG: ATP-binding protein [Lachnospiraceae bacterium]|nr:ATP-binding protein [Lachnospiraceae bacterium]